MLLAAQVRIIESGTGELALRGLRGSRGGKLEALEHVRTLFGVPRERCVAAGDSGNDILMLAGTPCTSQITLFRGSLGTGTLQTPFRITHAMHMAEIVFAS